jgi:hypothetical protein
MSLFVRKAWDGKVHVANYWTPNQVFLHSLHHVRLYGHHTRDPEQNTHQIIAQKSKGQIFCSLHYNLTLQVFPITIWQSLVTNGNPDKNTQSKIPCSHLGALFPDAIFLLLGKDKCLSYFSSGCDLCSSLHFTDFFFDLVSSYLNY